MLTGRMAPLQRVCERLLGRHGSLPARWPSDADMAASFGACGAPIVLADEHRRVPAVNRAYTELTGYTAAESVGQPLHLLPPSGAGAATDAEVDAGLAREGRWRGEVLQQHRDGSTSPAWMCLDLVGDGPGRPRRYVVTFADISLLRRGDERLRHMAHHDPLTDLPNRLLFESELARCVARAQRHSQQFAMLFLDLDHFKDVNDNFGHAAGDCVLRGVGQHRRGAVPGRRRRRRVADARRRRRDVPRQAERPPLVRRQQPWLSAGWPSSRVR